MNYMQIYKCAISDGPGVRVSLYISGCRNHCEGCHNKESWSFKAGKLFDEEAKRNLLDFISKPYIKGLTLCGGEPMEEENQRVLLEVVKEVKRLYPEKDIWSYTGYEFQDLLECGKKHCEVTDELLSYIDVLVVGRFILAERDITDDNRWRGSRNQRVVDVKESLKQNKQVNVIGIPNNN